MTRADRRSVLTGMGALGVAGCSPPSPVDAPPPLNRVRVQELDLSVLEARHGGRLGLSARTGDLHAGRARGIAWREDERFLYCSTFKLFLAAATLMRVQVGQEQLDRSVAITAADMLAHAPVTNRAVGSALSIQALCQAAVEQSDNPAANILVREMGGLDALRAWYGSMGDSVTRVDRWELELNRLDGDKDTTTPRMAALLINGLLFSTPVPALQPLYAHLLTSWMFESPTGPNRIKAGVPADWRVAHKTGTGGYGPTNDIGVLFPPSGDPIILAIYFHATSASTPSQRDAVIADATRLALAALGHGAAA